MYKYITRIVFIAIFCFLTGQLLTAQMFNRGMPSITHYTSEDYHSIDQNWAAIQDHLGVLYFGNTNGLIQFNGNEWTMNYLSRFMSIVRSLAINEIGTVYAGSINNFGYLETSFSGKVSFHNLSDQLPLNRRSFNDIWEIVCLENLVFFRATNSIFIYKNNVLLDIIDARSTYTRISRVRDKVYVHDKSTGIQVWHANHFEPVNGGDFFKNMSIAFLIPYGKTAIITGTQKNGIHCLDNGRLESWGESMPKHNNSEDINCGILLNEQMVATGTSDGVIHFYSLSGNHLGSVRPGKPIITNLLADREKNLWITTTNGIYHIEINSPFTYYFEPLGLNQISLDAAYFNHHIYVAGTDAVYYKPYDYHQKNKSSSKFEMLQESKGQSWHITTGNDQLLIAHNPGILILDRNSSKLYMQNHGNMYCAASLNTDPDIIIASIDNGLLRINLRNLETKQIWKLNETPRYMQITPDNEIWLITETLKGVYRICLTHNFDTVKTWTYYNNDKGLPDLPSLSIINSDSQIKILTENGFFLYHRESDQFEPDLKLNNKFEHGAYLANTDTAGNIWLGGMNYLTQLRRTENGEFIANDKVFRRILYHYIYSGTLLPDGTSILTCNKGIIQYDPAIQYSCPGFHALINKVQSLANDTSSYLTRSHLDSTDQNMLSGRTMNIGKISYDNNSIRFICASAYYVEPHRTLFSFRLDGPKKNDGSWTEWSTDHKKEFTNMYEGSYTFYVKAKNVYGEESSIAACRFTVLPPWYRSSFAYGFYIFTLILILLAGINLNTRRLRKKNLKLESIIRSRTNEIQSQKEEIERQQIIILSDRDNLKKLTRQLQDLNDFKSRFFANISHELRTPLTLIISPLEQLSGNSSDPKQHYVFNLMEKNAKRLLRLVNQLLDLSKLDKGSIPLRLEFMEINSFIAAIVQSFIVLAEKKNLSLSFIDECPDTWLPYDRDILEKIMDNLLSNAIKFTNDGGKIEVCLSLSEKNDKLQISISDTGIGIPDNMTDKIFERFYQAENPVAGKKDGFGIGLAFVKELLEIHRGDIRVNSKEGVGASFIIHLPFKETDYQTDQIYIPGDTDGHFILPDKDSVSVLGKLTTGKVKEKEIILVVEDNKDMIDFITNSLPEEYEVLKAKNGQEGLIHAMKSFPDLIITDVMMPEMDGTEMTRIIKGDRLTSHIPVIMLTARTSIESRIEGLEARADDYLSKPFSIKELIVRIRNLLLVRKELRQKFQRELLATPSEITTNSLDEEFLLKAIELVKNNMSNSNFGIDLMCRELAMSRSSLHRKLKALTNQSASEFISFIRIKEAAWLLKHSKDSISEIAYMVGFNSISYFNVLFRRYLGTAPSDFR